MLDAVDLSDRDLALNFESLGGDCEFGLAQRRANADPLGLIRFTAHTLPDLRDAIRTRFAHVTDDVVISVNAQNNYNAHCGRHDFLFATAQPAEADAAEAEVLRKNIRWIDFMRRKMIEDLTLGEKIFVRRSADRVAEAEIFGLWSDLNEYGPNTLLWVDTADEANPHGTLKVQRTGLMRGYLDARPTGVDGFVVDGPSWLRLCRKAWSAHLGLPFEPLGDIPGQPAAPVLVVPAANQFWQGELALGSNGRMQHLPNGSLGSFYHCDEVLHVRWDIWGSELFVRRDGVFRRV